MELFFVIGKLISNQVVTSGDRLTPIIVDYNTKVIDANQFG